MIDFLATVDPANELVSSRDIRPPRPPREPLWQGLVELNRSRTEATGPDAVLSPAVVGAYGISPADTLTRAAGEAVERFALLPVPGDEDHGRDPVRTGARILDPADPGVRLAAPGVRGRRLRVYEGRTLHDDAPLPVPAGLVDYPARRDDADGFDPSPSGAASGATREQALRSALLEVVERDAFLCAWYLGAPLRRLDPDRPAAGATLALRQFRRALEAARAIGLSPVLARVPTRVPGVFCTVGIVVDDRGDGPPLAAVGASASDDLGTSAVKALQEALQIRSALRLVQQRWAPGRATRRPRTDLERARYFASSEGVRAVERWVAGFPAPEEPAGCEVPMASAAPVGVESLVQALRRQGVTPLAVELTHRLPARIRSMGWHAVKVVPLGMQALRMDDTQDFTLHRARLTAVAERYGLGAGHAAAALTDPEPHPLI
ncbi:YcaO-like family protein [Streptomyces sp. NPDC050600]|uniref:YcaO-like family protein n=1 Tax=Streptomyces sp. NPDC050600 TaxID=3157213 RepID=UPI003440CD12